MTKHRILTTRETFSNINSYIELIFAIGSGIFIVAGWLLSKADLQLASIVSFLLAYGIGGYFKAKEGLSDTLLHKQLNVELLMVLAAIGSAIIGYWTEGALLIFIFALSGALETYTMDKSRKELSSLMRLQPEEAWLLENNKEYRVSVADLVVGNHILVKPGERIPADGIIKKGSTSIDESAITGESIPVSKEVGQEIFAGTVNGQGSIIVEITKPNSETLFQKIITLVQNAQSEKSPSQQFIERFEGTYVKIVLSVVALMMVLPHYLLDWSWNEAFYRAMVLLVVASPCAVVASIMPATLSAISNGARNGMLFKGGVHLETLGNIRAIAFDKTGTLTIGHPEVTNYVVVEEHSPADVLQIVASIEHHSNHPLAEAIGKFAASQMVDLLTPDSIEDVSGWGIQAIIQGQTWKIGKKDFMNKEKIDQFRRQYVTKHADSGKTIVYIQKEADIIGFIALKDCIRTEAKAAIDELQQLGIQPIMLTGDSQTTAAAIANEVGMTTFVAECLPEQKVTELKKIQATYGVTAMVGDGINDAPALASANVGIAMGQGTDVALETADIVLMKNELAKISEAVQLSKRMNRIIKQNLFFSIGVLFILVLSNFFQAIDLPFGVIGHEGSTILVILNGLRLLKQHQKKMA
ncbi:heavy metal translocating P-type ATPase [Caldibacillus lycopersici]|uniref:Heavy metal translocating P-type ATPase n=1 Tax=Perspicuibacillus lycopersici TaxID=1325689 RepID=A0AAE3LP15_9BACI|nr:heavy metal translocating P-type ATPase [Perspicuibacillus lycopersici]MCU9614516.1 heavy metal translocating P-type ATPase [Perspicuibacillus lycopersici]